MKKLSPKAYGMLIAIVQHDLTVSAESMMNYFGIGRDSALSGLKELKNHGYMVTKDELIYGKPRRVSRITEAGKALFFGVKIETPKSENPTRDTSTEQIKQNKTYSTLISKPNLEAEPQGETEEYVKVGYEFFDRTSEPDEDSDDPKDRRLAAERRRKKDYEEKRSKVFKSRFQKRHENPVSEWSVNDVCFEFADRIFQHWHIKPWSVTESAFSGALATARKRLDTTSEIEVACMDLFFKQVPIKDYKDAEILWKLFVSRLPSLIGQAKMTVTTTESKDVAQKAREKARKLLLGEDV